MGIYLNPGNQRFMEAMSSQVFVDKTEMILYLNSVVSTEQKYVSVSRPRRFGKSMAINMLSAYYGRGTDSRALFEKTQLCHHEDWGRHLQAFDVIRLTMTDFMKSRRSVEASIDLMCHRILEELEEAYPETKYDSEDFFYSLQRFYQKSQKQFVILIDEWDVVFRKQKENKEEQEFYLDFLRDWLKDKDYIALAYMTGILPIKKYGKHSALNMFDEYSMVYPMQMARFTGFTEDEVSSLCIQYGRDFDQIREWYDGYVVSDILPPDPEYRMQETVENELKPRTYSLYSPLSVVKAVMTGQIRNYWNKTETYEALADYIRMDYDGLRETVALLMDGVKVSVDLRRYQNDMTTFYSKDDVLALLIHLGYLGYDEETGEVFIPNKEILDEFKASTATEDWRPVFAAFRTSQKLLEATWAGDSEHVAGYLEEAHDRAGNQTYSSEAALSYAIQLAYYSAQKYYTTILELDTGKGYADVVYLPSPKYPEKPALLIELKYGKTTRTAMDQIRGKNYPQRLEHYKGNLLLVAVNYDKKARSDDPEFKHHTCVIERA